MHSTTLCKLIWAVEKTHEFKTGVRNPRPAGHNPALQASQCGPRRWQDKKNFFLNRFI